MHVSFPTDRTEGAQGTPHSRSVYYQVAGSWGISVWPTQLSPSPSVCGINT